MREDDGHTGIDQPAPANQAKAAVVGWACRVLFLAVTLLPVIRRLAHPTILGDDITRIVDLVKYPFREHLFLPFAEHIAPLFQLVSWVTWELIGHDVRLAPLGYSAASVLSWVLVLVLLGWWLFRETRSRTATLVAVALAAQSPLVLETSWWYSASSFLWAIAGILLAILGATFLSRRTTTGLLLVALGSALGLAGTTLGILAGPLAITRTALEPQGVALEEGRGRPRRGGRRRHLSPGLQGGGRDGLSHRPALGAAGRRPVGRALLCAHGARAGTLAVAPGRAHFPHDRTPRGMALPRGRGSRLDLDRGAGVLAQGAVEPPARLGRGSDDLWMLYINIFSAGGHAEAGPVDRAPVPLPVRFAISCAATSGVSFNHRRPAGIVASAPPPGRPAGVPALVAAVVGLVTMFVQEKETSFWNWMLTQPDQQVTLAAVHHVGDLARDAGISRSQLMRVFDPVHRPWNGSVKSDRPYAFHLMNLAVQAPMEIEPALPDDVARARLLAALDLTERIALGSGTCGFRTPEHMVPPAQTLAVGRRVGTRNVSEPEPGTFRPRNWPAYLEYEFDSAPDARYLVFPGLAADQDVVISFGEPSGQWHQGQNARWLKASRADAAIDLERLIHRPRGPVSRIRLQFTRPGELALEGSPRLLR